MKKIITLFFLFMILLGFIATAYFLYEKSQKKPIVYKVEQAFIGDIVKKTVATGRVIPRKEIELKTQVSGVIQEIFAEAGELIKKGDVIAKIELIPDVQLLNNAKSQLERAQINFKNAKQEFQRQKSLYDDRLTSAFEFNKFKLQFELEKESVVAAENAIALIMEGASGRVDKASNLVYATIDGMVIDVPVKEGVFVTETNTFNNGTTIASLANMQDMIFEGKIDESEVSKLTLGMPLELTIGAITDSRYSAKLEFISPKGFEDQGTIKFEIRASIQLLPDQFLRAGYSANADIVLDKRSQVLLVNESLLVIENDKVYVDVKQADSTFERREIKTGLSDGINIEVLSGLTEQDALKVF